MIRPIIPARGPLIKPPPENIVGADTPPRRAGWAFPAILGDNFPASPDIVSDGGPRGYDWRPAVTNLDRSKIYRLLAHRDGLGNVDFFYWSPVQFGSLALNMAERWAYEPRLHTGPVPAGMPVIMYFSWVCFSAAVSLAATDGDGGLPTPLGRQCDLTYWFYHWVDPDSRLCNELDAAP